MSADPRRPFWRNWALLVPILGLAAVGLAMLVHEPRTPRTIPIQLTPPAQTELAEIPLPARVRSVEGRVVDADDVAQAGALIWLLSGDEPRWTNTGEDGSFRLAGLQRGPWDARVVAEDHRPFPFVLAESNNAIVVRLPDSRRVAPVVVPLVRARLLGTLIGTADQELEGAEIVLNPTLPPEAIDSPLPRRTQADATGRFAFEQLVVGEYKVSVIPGWASGGSWPDLSRGSDEPASRLFVHRADGSASLTIDLVAGAAAGSLVDAEGRSIEGALVVLAPIGRADRPWPPAATDASGAFEFRGLPPGLYELDARAGNTHFARQFEVRPRSRIDLGRLPTVPLR